MQKWNRTSLLTQDEDAFLRHPWRCHMAHRSHRDRVWRDDPIVLDVDAKALAVLVESATCGHRLYELMWLRKPGDLFRYWMACPLQLPEEALRRAKASASIRTRARFGEPSIGTRLPFLELDSAFGHLANSHGADFDASSRDDAWVGYRRSHPRPAVLDQQFQIVRAAQSQLRVGASGLLAHELALIDAGRHVRDAWPAPGHVELDAEVPINDSAIDADLLQALVDLASRQDVRSLSCDLVDRGLWRELVWVQVRRAKEMRLDPEHALLLAGPDSGLVDAYPKDWGGEIHIPYEGVRNADVFVVPSWFAFDAAKARAAGTVAAGLWNKAQRFAIFDRDVGDHPRDERMRCGNWTIYRIAAR